MERLRSRYWKISFVNTKQEEEWNSAYRELEPGYRWQVDSALNYLVLYKDPWRRYKNMKCDECMDGVYILNVSHSGIGDKTVQVTVWFDVPNRLLVPLDCELV